MEATTPTEAVPKPLVHGCSDVSKKYGRTHSHSRSMERSNVMKEGSDTSMNKWLTMTHDGPPVATQTEVSRESCSEVVRFVSQRMRKKGQRSSPFSDWNLYQELVFHPPIVFNGTFPIDQPISSRFVNGRNNVPETINEMSGEANKSSSYSDSESEGANRNFIPKGSVTRSTGLFNNSRVRRRKRSNLVARANY